MLENYPCDVLNIDELCAILRIGRNNAYKLLREKTIPSTKLQRKYIIPKNGVIHYIEQIEQNYKKDLQG